MLSIVVLTHNRHGLLRDCLRSLAAQQDPLGTIELVVADDGSTDDTAAVVAAFERDHGSVIYARQPHKGIPAARNLGIRHARGAIVAIVADDYLLAPDYARTVIGFFENHPRAEVVRFRIVAARHDLVSRLSHLRYEVAFRNRLHHVGRATRDLSKLRRYLGRPRAEMQEVTTDHDLEAAGAAAFRSSVFERVGLFDEDLPSGEDTDYAERLKAAGIDIYYDPFHPVRHQYVDGALAALRSCFLQGISQCRIHRKSGQRTSAGRKAAAVIRGLVGPFAQGIWGARQVEGAKESFLFLPAWLVSEFTVKLGFCWGFLTDRWRPGAPRL